MLDIKYPILNININSYSCKVGWSIEMAGSQDSCSAAGNRLLQTTVKAEEVTDRKSRLV